MITSQSCSQNRTALDLNLLIMDNYNNYNHDEILSEYWCTDTPSSDSDDSGDTEDELMDLTGIFIALIMEQVVFYRKVREGSIPHIYSYGGNVGFRVTQWPPRMNSQQTWSSQTCFPPHL